MEGFSSQLLFTIDMEVEEKPEQMEGLKDRGGQQRMEMEGEERMVGEENMKGEKEEQILIMMDGLDEAEGNPDLLDVLGSEPQTVKKSSLTYDYQPAQPEVLEGEAEGAELQEVEGGLKTSNRSTSTCADSEPVRKCTCTKTRCQKNYCQCFKLGEACTAECECKDCGNREKLFLGRAQLKIKCKCLKSHCLKNYCECHSMGLRCGPDCKCLECQNMEEAVEWAEHAMHDYFDHHLYFAI